MDITAVFGTVILGSNPGGSTINNKVLLGNVTCVTLSSVLPQKAKQLAFVRIRKSEVCFCSNRNNEERPAKLFYRRKKVFVEEIPGGTRYTWNRVCFRHKCRRIGHYFGILLHAFSTYKTLKVLT